MAPNRGRNRAAEFEELVKPVGKDFDPEEEDIAVDDSDEEPSEAEDDFDGREHYVAVTQSKLRKPTKAVPLGPKYRGSQVGRDALDQDSDSDDPFNKSFDEEEESDADGDLEMADGEGSGDDDSEGSEEEGDEEGTSDTDMSEDNGDELMAKPGDDDAKLRKELEKVVGDDLKNAVSASISRASKEDAEKGRAVKKQRTAFDSLLNTRMKMQKSLIATNTLAGLGEDQIAAEKDDAEQALEAAETAAFNLWNTLNTFREDLLASRAGQKRKRASFSLDTPTEDLWAHEQSQEAEIKPTRDAVLKKWSAKSQGPTVVADKTRLNKKEHQATIIDVLQEQLSNSERLVKRTQAPRSCAPLQVSQGVTESEKIYDDADFYGLLLKELLEQKSQDSVAASNIDIGFQMRREAKVKKNVDTKASKGRKLRYTVHEKLQNFMAPEDRSKWGERQADELFGSLFGQRMALGEDDEMGDEEDGIDPEEAGLMLFRN
ncbi:related to Che-1 protein [Ramularia collo-cygni]|uniref:Protein BFR2 n=1 Tax=Ramularia collo-cygni TaxID=112498 RepID=A0A2D3VFB0_9PEZI|nr:related to Che-1 protein [Ramularia collo-cygni]CZT24545.1 related to Che-1 protein [Ramularia collo-cygni]